MRSKKRKRAVILAVCLIMAMMMSACGTGASTGSAPSSSAGGGSNKPIKIGVSTEATGSSTETSVNLLQGAQIAVEMINEKGGIKGRPIELVVRDTEENPTRGVSIIRDFSQKENVIAGIGGYLSTVMLAQTPVIKEEKLPFIVATSNVPESVKNGLPWTFGVRMNAEITAKYALNFMEKQLHASKVAILYESGGYGKGALAAMTKALEEVGKKPVAAESFNLKDQDMTAQVTRARDAGADVIYLFGIGASNGYVLKSMDKIGWKVPVIGENGMAAGGVYEVAGALSNGTYAIQTANFVSEQTRDMAKQFLERFKKKFGHIPTTYAVAAQGFDGTMLLAKALEQIDLTDDIKKDREALKDALENKAGPYQGVIRDWDKAFSKDNHDAIDVNSYLMNVWKDGVLIRSDKQ
jgi:branched-chain amino acid transport system substrate-binding protein